MFGYFLWTKKCSGHRCTQQRVEEKKAEMGVFQSKVRGLLGESPRWKILMLGLDSAGKTTCLYKFKLGKVGK